MASQTAVKVHSVQVLQPCWFLLDKYWNIISVRHWFLLPILHFEAIVCLHQRRATCYFLTCVILSSILRKWLFSPPRKHTLKLWWFVTLWATLTHPVSYFSYSVFHSDSWRPLSSLFDLILLTHLSLSHNTFMSLTVPDPLCDSLGRYCFPVNFGRSRMFLAVML